MAKKDGKENARELGIKTAKNTLIYTVGNIVGSLAVLLLLIILARLLNASDFGLYAIAIAFYNLLSGHFVFGVAMRKDLPQMKNNKEKMAELISNAYIIALSIAVLVSLAAALLSGFIAVNVYNNPAMTNKLALASALVFFYALFNLTLATLIALEKTKNGTMMYLLYAFIQLVLSTTLVIMGYGIMGALIGLGIGLLIPSILGIYLIFRHVDRKFVGVRKATIKHLLGFSAPVMASNLAMYGPPNLAILLLGVYATSLIVGNYNAAFRFGNFVAVILVSISFVLLPAFSKAFSEKRLSEKIGHIYNSSIYYTLLFLFPIIIFVVSTSTPLLNLLFSGRYNLAPLYFVVIVLGSTIGIISTYASNLQVGYGDTKRFMYYQLLAVVIQILLLFALTPIFGAWGVLLALFVISQVLVDIVYVYALRKQFKFKHEFNKIIRLTIPSLILIGLLYLLTGILQNSLWSLITNIVLIMLLFPPIAVLSGAVKRENIDFVREVAEKIKMGRISACILSYAEFFLRTDRKANDL